MHINESAVTIFANKLYATMYSLNTMLGSLKSSPKPFTQNHIHTENILHNSGDLNLTDFSEKNHTTALFFYTTAMQAYPTSLVMWHYCGRRLRVSTGIKSNRKYTILSISDTQLCKHWKPIFNHEILESGLTGWLIILALK